MSTKAENLAKRFTAFNNEFAAFVESCPEKDWSRLCPGENWPVGVVARHVGRYRSRVTVRISSRCRRFFPVHGGDHEQCRRDRGTNA